MTKEIMQFTKTELENELNTIKDWLDFDEDFKNNFINQLSGLGFTSPRKEDVFNAFKLFKPNETKVLIIGQDPYTENSGKADGCAFSVKNNAEDASLLNIYKAIKVYQYKENNLSKTFKGINKEINWKTDLKIWAENEKVLLLNTALTHSGTDKSVIKNHREAWEPFIFHILAKLLNSKNKNKLVVFLWGKHAQATFLNALQAMGKQDPDKCYLTRRMILMTSHPSNTGGSVHLGFSEDAPIHFKACDDFLKSDIWKGIDKYLKK